MPDSSTASSSRVRLCGRRAISARGEQKLDDVQPGGAPARVAAAAAPPPWCSLPLRRQTVAAAFAGERADAAAAVAAAFDPVVLGV